MAARRVLEVGVYLKYYFSFIDEKVSLNCVACKDGEEPQVPRDFLKWYEEGDIDFTVVDAQEQGSDLVFWNVFAPRKITFDIEDFRRKTGSRVAWQREGF